MWFAELRFHHYKADYRTSLVVQWVRICLPTQGTWVQSLVQKHPTCHRATKPVCHNYRSPWAWSLCSRTGEATAMRSLRAVTETSLCLLQLEKSLQEWRPSTAKKKKESYQTPILSKSPFYESLWRSSVLLKHQSKLITVCINDKRLKMGWLKI